MDTLGAPATPTMSEQATAGVVGLVADAVWAPSVHNTQPWWFSMTPDGLCLYADPARQLATADPDGREMLISCGAALFTARLALRAAGWIPETQVLPDPARPLLVGQLSWHRRSAPVGYERQLYDQVRLRRSHRGGFDPAPPAPQLLALLRESAARYGAVLRVVTDQGTRALLADAGGPPSMPCRWTARASANAPRGRPRQAARGRTGCRRTAYPARAERTYPDFPAPDFARGRGWGMPPLSTIPGRSPGRTGEPGRAGARGSGTRPQAERVGTQP